MFLYRTGIYRYYNMFSVFFKYHGRHGYGTVLKIFSQPLSTRVVALILCRHSVQYSKRCPDRLEKEE